MTQSFPIICIALYIGVVLFQIANSDEVGEGFTYNE